MRLYLFTLSIRRKGYHQIGIGGRNQTLVSHIGYLRELEQSGRIEEMLMHETANACLEQHQNVIMNYTSLILA